MQIVFQTNWIQTEALSQYDYFISTQYSLCTNPKYHKSKHKMWSTYKKAKIQIQLTTEPQMFHNTIYQMPKKTNNKHRHISETITKNMLLKSIVYTTESGGIVYVKNTLL